MLGPRQRGRISLLGVAAITGALAPGTLGAQVATPVEDHAHSPPAAAEAARQAKMLTDHVVIISVDGLRPDAIDLFGASNMQRLMRRGSYSFTARTILLSITLPSHTSMLTGVEPEVHGVTWNDNQTDAHGTIATPTIFAVAHQNGLETAAFFSKGKFQHLLTPGTIDHAEAPDANGKWLSGNTADRVVSYLEHARPNLTFVHFGDADYAGHALGWMGTAYGYAVRRVDQGIGRVIAAADHAFGPGGYTVIVTADHGGQGMRHGSGRDGDARIPWIAYGRGVQGGRVLTADIHTTDTAATALWLLGIDLPAASGQPIRHAFRPAAPAVSATGP